jgi:two-component system sensor histidine kinase VicK
MNHVVSNLANNAINYTPLGSVSVKLEERESCIRFSITDTGVGLSEEDKAVLFTEGGHGKEARAVNPHSTGYGLFIAKRIVDAHHGRIWAESEGRGKGSTFIVEIPTTLTHASFKA